MRARLGVLLLLAGCSAPAGKGRSGAPDPWDALAAEARALRPATPAGDAAILDGLEARARDTLASLKLPEDRAAWEKLASNVRTQLRASLGLDRLPPPKPAKVRSVGTIDRGDYKIEKLVFESFPSVDVPAHLYMPASRPGKVPGILFVPGHWWADAKTKTDFQAFAITMARHGFAVITYDPFGQGERGISVRDHRRTELLAVGVAQEAIVVHESLCALELLLARPEVDPGRVGMTGASGGGFNSWIVPALEPRISVTVPVVGTSDLLEQLRAVRNVDWFAAKEHCHFIPRLFRYANHHQLLACVAPRPVMVISAHDDIAFPIPGQRDVVKYGERLYAALGVAGRVGYYEDSVDGHGYQKRKREAAVGWFLKWMKNEGDGSPVPEPAIDVPAWDLPELRCFPPGQNRPAGPGLVALALRLARTPEEASPETIDRDRRALAAVLGLQYPLALPPAPDLVRVDDRLATGSVRPDTSRVERVGWRMPDGVLVPGVLLKPTSEAKGLLLGAADAGKEALLEHPAVRAAHEAGWAVLLADPRGMGDLAITKPGWVYATSLLLGENLVGRQAQDLIAGVRSVRSEPGLRGKPVGLLGTGLFASLAGLYAVILEKDIAWLAAEGGLDSFSHLYRRPRSSAQSFVLATPEREREVRFDREIPHALIPWDIHAVPDIPAWRTYLGKSRAVWAAAVDGEFEPAPGPSSCLSFVRERLEESR